MSAPAKRQRPRRRRGEPAAQATSSSCPLPPTPAIADDLAREDVEIDRPQPPRAERVATDEARGR